MDIIDIVQVVAIVVLFIWVIRLRIRATNLEMALDRTVNIIDKLIEKLTPKT